MKSLWIKNAYSIYSNASLACMRIILTVFLGYINMMIEIYCLIIKHSWIIKINTTRSCWAIFDVLLDCVLMFYLEFRIICINETFLRFASVQYFVYVLDSRLYSWQSRVWRFCFFLKTSGEVLTVLEGSALFTVGRGPWEAPGCVGTSFVEEVVSDNFLDFFHTNYLV